MTDPVTLALVAASGVIVIGFLSNYLFSRTRLPDMLFLIGLGMVLGPLLQVFDPASAISLAPYFAAVAVVIILFEGGLSMNLYQVLSVSLRATLLAILSFTFSLVSTTLFMYSILGLPVLYGVLLGSICGGSSSIIVMSIARRIGASEQASTVLSLESAITDILCVVTALAVTGIIVTGQAYHVAMSREIAARFSVGAVIGVIVGFFWLIMLPRLLKEPYAYMLTLAIALFGYSASEYLGGSGALSSLLFGLVLGNEREIFMILRREKMATIVDEGMKRFESEIAFLIRSFFFVYLGLIVTIRDVSLLVSGVALALLFLFVRYGAVWLATARSELQQERPIMSLVLTRGLAAAVLSTLPMQFGLEYADLYINITLVVIVATAIICTVGTFALQHSERKIEDRQETSETR